MRFVMADCGSAFSTRDRGIRLLSELEYFQASARHDDLDLTLDFTDVMHVSGSFADEFVGSIVGQRRSLGLEDPEIVGAIPFVRKVIDRTMRALSIEPALSV